MKQNQEPEEQKSADPIRESKKSYELQLQRIKSTEEEASKNKRRQELIEALARKHEYVMLLGPDDELNQAYGLNLKFDRPGFNIHAALSVGLGFRGYCEEHKDNADATIIRTLRNLAQTRILTDVENRLACIEEKIDKEAKALEPFFNFGIYYDWPYNMNSHRDKTIKSIKERSCTKETFDSVMKVGRGYDFVVQWYLEQKEGDCRSIGEGYLQGEPEVQQSESERKPNKEISKRQWEEYKREHLNPASNQETSSSKTSGILSKTLSYVLGGRK